MLEHLDGDDAVVRPNFRRLERDHVGGDDLQVLDAALRRARRDELLLRPGVRDTRDLRKRIRLGHPERKRAPAASKLKDVLPVRKLGALAVKLQHREFRLVQSHAGLVVQATRVFQVAAQTKQVKFRWNLVVLLVRGFRLLGDCAGAQVLHEIDFSLKLILGVCEVEKALRSQQVPDASAQDEVRHEVHLHDLRVRRKTGGDEHVVVSPLCHSWSRASEDSGFRGWVPSENTNSADDVDDPSRAYHEEDLVERIVEGFQGGIENRQERAQHR